MFAVNNLAQYSVAPRQGHLAHLLRIFGYLSKYPFAATPFDGHFIDSNVTNQLEFQPLHDWKEIFPNAYEDIPPNAPSQKDGERFQITCYVDADHARNTVTRRSVTGILLLINNTPLTWISRRQRTVETSTFGSEVIAARTAIDLIVEMRYKLRCIGLPLERSSTLIGDNKSVILNTTSPASKIKKKHLSCQLMRVREAIAGGYVKFVHIISPLNMADGLTKPLSKTEHHEKFHYYLFRHLLQHHDKDVGMILPQPQNRQLRQLSKNTSKKHNEFIEQLRIQQQDTPKRDEATTSTKTTEPTTQTPSTSTSQENKLEPPTTVQQPTGIPPILGTYNMVQTDAPASDNPQDDSVLYQATESNHKDPPPDSPPKTHDDEAISRDTEEPFFDPDRSNCTTNDTMNTDFVQKKIIIDNLETQPLIHEIS